MAKKRFSVETEPMEHAGNFVVGREYLNVIPSPPGVEESWVCVEADPSRGVVTFELVGDED